QQKPSKVRFWVIFNTRSSWMTIIGFWSTKLPVRQYGSCPETPFLPLHFGARNGVPEIRKTFVESCHSPLAPARLGTPIGQNRATHRKAPIGKKTGRFRVSKTGGSNSSRRW